jgi:hypothetical protein
MADIILRFVYPDPNSDIRTFRVCQVFEGMSGELELYKVAIRLYYLSLQLNNSRLLCLVLSSDDRSSKRHDHISQEESKYAIRSTTINPP